MTSALGAKPAPHSNTAATSALAALRSRRRPISYRTSSVLRHGERIVVVLRAEVEPFGDQAQLGIREKTFVRAARIESREEARRGARARRAHRQIGSAPCGARAWPA